MIKRLLVANRGEIAVRIMATAAVPGVETVELPRDGRGAYLDVDAVVGAVMGMGMGCDMLHPGYGFLSEQPRLAERCAEAGGRFVGPAPGALALFGDKTATRARAREIGLPVLAGTDADLHSSRRRPCCASTARSWLRRWPPEAGAACAR
jgi:acetyl/propionyl-CoA carboxylase alpha subunit